MSNARIILDDGNGHYVAGRDGDELVWTNDPREARQFDDENAAMGFVPEGSLVWPRQYGARVVRG